MIPVENVTRGQSEENFKNHSLLSKREVLYALDAWIDKVRANQYEIRISDAGKRVLRGALLKLRASLLQKDMPTLDIYGRRYVLDIFADGVQCGYEAWDNAELFNEEGNPVPWMEEEGESEEDTKSPEFGGKRPEFSVVERIPIRLDSIEKWAKDNDVKLSTARQWAARGRIQTTKEGRDLKVSPIQYTPKDFASSKYTSCRLSGMVRVDGKWLDKYPFLFAETFDVVVMPQEEDAAKDSGESSLFVVGRDSGNETLSVREAKIPQADRFQFVDDLSDAGFTHRGNYMLSPIGEALFSPSYRFSEITCPRKEESISFPLLDAKVSIEGSGSLPFRNPTREDVEEMGGLSPSVAMDISFEGKSLLSLTGHLLHRNETAEINLLKTIFGEHPTDKCVTEAQKKAGVMESRLYPWDKDVLLVEDILVEDTSCMNADALSQVLRSIPYLMKRVAFARPTCMILQLTSNNVPAIYEAAEKAGFKLVHESKVSGSKKGSKKVYHAYVGTGTIIRGKKDESEEK